MILNWPIPKNLTQLQSFLGLVNYYRRFIKNFAEFARPLQNLTRKNIPFVWTEEYDIAFETLKNKITSPPVLAFPNFSKPLVLQTDSSNYQIGGVLANHDGHPIAFISCILDVELNGNNFRNSSLF